MSGDAAWVMVGELAKGFERDNNTLPETTDLVGKTVPLVGTDHEVTEYRFETSERLAWEEPSGSRSGTGRYTATTLRQSIYFVDFILSEESATSQSLVLDLGRNLYTSVTARLPQVSGHDESLFRRAAAGRELTAVEATIVSGIIKGSGAKERPIHQPTEEMVGKRIMYIYSDTERYEHVYLNPNFYTWHCLEGVEKGLADTDRCHYVKIDRNLYLFVWREKIIPTVGVVMIDLDRMKTTGKILGYEGQGAGALSNFPVGAHARLLNVTTYTF